TFRLLFPAVDEPAALAAIPPAADIEGHGETILVVEDEAAMMEVTARILRHHGYTVVEATNGPEAIALAAQPDVRLLLTDSVMPQMSGRELARQIRELRPELPVLFMSGYDQKVIGTRRVLGEDIALVQKPFNAETLLTWVRSVMPRASV
ncbi:MAG TPA: response regulator, partial [Streptosporangiaceae bacterium]